MKHILAVVPVVLVFGVLAALVHLLGMARGGLA